VADSRCYPQRLDFNCYQYVVVNDKRVALRSATLCNRVQQMISTKLQEALNAIVTERKDLEVRRERLDAAEQSLRLLLSSLADGAQSKPERENSRYKRAGSSPAERDGLDDIIDILKAEGKPLHITVIAQRLSTLRGTPVDRTKIEPGINRHVAKAKTLRLDKFAPSTFGLPEWKQEPLGRTAA
jgi:hypothetical protein